MNKKTRALTLSALLTALTVAALYIALLLPPWRESIAALASVFTAAAVIELGLRRGIYVYVASSLLAILILPTPIASLAYIVFFGYYPIVKSLIERLRSAILRWALKIGVFLAALTIYWRLITTIFIDDSLRELPGFLFIALGGAVLMVVFDYGFTKVIWLYINRVSKYVKR